MYTGTKKCDGTARCDDGPVAMDPWRGFSGKLPDRRLQEPPEGQEPDLPLIEALAAVGVEVYLCGQSAAHRGFARDDLAPDVRLALSAMTVLVAL